MMLDKEAVNVYQVFTGGHAVGFIRCTRGYAQNLTRSLPNVWFITANTKQIVF